MNLFDKICAALAFILGMVFIATGLFGVVFGCHLWATLPPVLGLLPAFFGWGMVRAVHFAWKDRSAESAEDRLAQRFRPQPQTLESLDDVGHSIQPDD